jgi:hypothetical protein
MNSAAPGLNHLGAMWGGTPLTQGTSSSSSKALTSSMVNHTPWASTQYCLPPTMRTDFEMPLKSRRNSKSVGTTSVRKTVCSGRAPCPRGCSACDLLPLGEAQSATWYFLFGSTSDRFHLPVLQCFLWQARPSSPASGESPVLAETSRRPLLSQTLMRCLGL